MMKFFLFLKIDKNSPKHGEKFVNTVNRTEIGKSREKLANCNEEKSKKKMRRKLR